MACPCGKLQVSVELEDVDFAVKAFFSLMATLSVHDDVRVASLCTVMLVFQQFRVHGRFEPLWFKYGRVVPEHPTFPFI